MGNTIMGGLIGASFKTGRQPMGGGWGGGGGGGWGQRGGGRKGGGGGNGLEGVVVFGGGVKAGWSTVDATGTCCISLRFTVANV
ncbi:unnamed protein product [Dicrocoelium dendriticum]|nr:unnamed protein product [Dicrocoelium dendriticum]